jgi:hypothetical protein
MRLPFVGSIRTVGRAAIDAEGALFLAAQLRLQQAEPRGEHSGCRVQGSAGARPVGMAEVFGEDWFYDPRSKKPDFSDARYHGIAKCTIGVKVGPYRYIDRFGTPYTQALHVIERYRLLDYEATKEALERAAKEWPSNNTNIDREYRGKGLQLEFAVEDEGVFTMPWSATITYGRDASPDWEERVCAENVQHDYQELHYSDKDAHPLTADKPDF